MSEGVIEMADNEIITGVKSNENAETVDDILAEILNNDGTFKDEFNSLLAKYIGVSQQDIVVPKVDISDRSDEENPRERAVFDSPDVKYDIEKSVDERIAEKLPEAIREMYSEASSDAQRPEFTSTGDVKYPTMGIGEAEQRVVFDADWEEKAKEEAARLERVRQDRMLRGDSAYARTFVAGGMYMSQRNRYVNEPSSGSLYIDPLSRDEDFETADTNSEYFNHDKKPFFPEGFSVIPRSNGSAYGKTARAAKSSKAVSVKTQGKIDENTYESFARSHERAEKARTSWLEVEDKNDRKKKRSLFGKKSRSGSAEKRKTEYSAPLKITVPEETAASEDEYIPDEPIRVMPYDTDVYQVADETEGLRTAVAEIVDKYNKRNEEDEKKRLEEEARKAEMRRIEEEERLRREEELRLLKAEMSPEVAEFIGNGEDDDFGAYDDFVDIGADGISDNISDTAEKSTADVKKNKAVTLSGAVPGADYLEKLESADEEIPAAASYETENNSEDNAGQSKKTKNSRNRKNGGRKNK